MVAFECFMVRALRMIAKSRTVRMRKKGNIECVKDQCVEQRHS